MTEYSLLHFWNRCIVPVGQKSWTTLKCYNFDMHKYITCQPVKLCTAFHLLSCTHQMSAVHLNKVSITSPDLPVLLHTSHAAYHVLSFLILQSIFHWLSCRIYILKIPYCRLLGSNQSFWCRQIQLRAGNLVVCCHLITRFRMFLQPDTVCDALTDSR